MSDLLTIDARFIPYPDGSGHQVQVVVDQACSGGPAQILISMPIPFGVEHWPGIKREIDRMVDLFPTVAA